METKKVELGDGEPSPPPNNSETLARWIWTNFVGIPVTEPYDKEYIALFNRIEKLQREWFVKGLTEARKQLGRSGAAQEVSPPAKCKSCGTILYRTLGEKGDYCDQCAPVQQEVSPPSPQPRSDNWVVPCTAALRKWELDTGGAASAPEGNAFMDGFRAGMELGDTRELKAAIEFKLPIVAKKLKEQYLKSDRIGQLDEADFRAAFLAEIEGL